MAQFQKAKSIGDPVKMEVTTNDPRPGCYPIHYP